jgi:translin
MRTPNLQTTTADILGRFDILSAARDRALTEGRQIIRLSANTVRAVHRGELAEAASLLAEAKALLDALVEHIAPYPSIHWAGYVQDAMKEFAEANLTLAIVGGNAMPGPGDLGVEDAPYLNALAESASELRREILDRLRADELDRAESLLAAMDEIYDVLITVDFPDAITGGLRRTTDQLRGVLERTRGDLTVALTQKRLQRSLAEARAALGDTSPVDTAPTGGSVAMSEDES